MTRKDYESPELEIEKFTIYTETALSNGFESGGSEEVDDDDFDF